MFVVIVAGSRSFSDRSLMYKKLDYYLQNQDKVLIVHGGANGADKCAAMYAKERGIKTHVIYQRKGKSFWKCLYPFI